jgi:hypothetical protein
MCQTQQRGQPRLPWLVSGGRTFLGIVPRMNQAVALGGILFVSIAALGGIMLMRPAEGNDFASKTTREIALTCTTDMATEYHIHPILKIFINDVEVEIPANVGIEPTCMRSLHTHTADGVLHVEAPVQRDFTLADFFAVWEKTFSATELMGNVANETHAVTMTVNGESVDTFENTIFKDADRIELRYDPRI